MLQPGSCQVFIIRQHEMTGINISGPAEQAEGQCSDNAEHCATPTDSGQQLGMLCA